MKKILGIFIILLNTLMIHAQSWNSEVSSITIGSNQTISSASDRNGIHILYHSNGTLKYGRINSAGSTIIADVTIATGIGNYAAITTYNDKIFAVYEKNTDIYISKSTDGGSNWTSPLESYTRSITFGSLSTTSDFKGVHIVWSEYGGGSNEAYYVLAVLDGQNPRWDYFKEVSDYSNHTGVNPSVATSSNEVHVTYQGTTGTAKSRDFRINESIPFWEDPITLQYSPSGTVSNNRTVVVGNAVHIICLEYYYVGDYYTYNVRHYVRDANSTSFSTTILADQYNVSSPNLHLLKSVNGNIHLMYNIRTSNTSTHVRYNGASWSTVITNLLRNNRNHISSAGNDLYLVQEHLVYSNMLSLRQYDDAPVAPVLMSIGSQNQVTVNWAWNPEPDINNYEVWRKYYRSKFDQQDWTLKATPTSNSWTDPDFQLSGVGNTYTVYYKTKAKDKTNHYSSFSSDVSTSAVMVYGKRGILTSDEVIPDHYELKQNYPNPFNPTTNITFALPEASSVTLTVYDGIGREVTTLFDGYLSEGAYTASFDASTLTSGMYFYTLHAGKFTATRKMLLTK